ncbi:peptidoglycan-binding protein [Candidatus Kaiserbacteria bacterium]|nr:MAG: peptidoglycan-binding protein [Candidatus Kaiserbacteria bacterium]
MMKYIYTAMITLLLVGAVVVPGAQAATTSNEAMLEQIKVLMAKVEELQKQLSTIRGEVKSLIKDGLEEGMTDTDITKLQELLATDPTIYPEGRKTGYFGPLTKEAVMRFQTRHGLEVTGKVNGETRDMLEEYLREGI